MRTVVWGLVLMITLAVQATLVPFLAIQGIKPDLLLLVVVSSALLLGTQQGVGMGFFAGLLQDLAAGTIFGSNVLSKLATGSLAGSLERKVFKENTLLPVLAVIVATLINQGLRLLILVVLGYTLNFGVALTNLFYLVAYNSVLAIPVHYLVYRLTQWWVLDP
jgi:rod shape-determining protein MreD